MRPEFERARTQELYEAELRKLNARFPLLQSRYIDQYAAHMLQADRDGHSLAVKAAAVRDAGRQCTLDEKRALGVPTRQKLGWDFALTVMPLALTNPLEAGRAIAIVGSKAFERIVHKTLCLANNVPARLLIRDDDRTCEAAKAYLAGILPVREVPEFPLRKCDKWVCRCTFNRYAEWMGGRVL